MSAPPAYPLPNATGETAQETWRLEQNFHNMNTELGGLTLRPFPPSMKSVLDLGCGTGIWMRSMATQHPDTSFLGVDVSPPVEGALQTAFNDNCPFIKADIEDDWTFVPEGSVDYTVARMLAASIRDWQGLYDKAFRATKPGGYIETVDTLMGIGSDDDEMFKKSSPFLRWFERFREFVSAGGAELNALDTGGQRLEAAGFKIIAEKPFTWWYDPTRPEMKGRKQCSHKTVEQMFDLLDVVTPKIFAQSLEEGQKLAAEAKVDIRENSGKVGFYTRYHARVAQKPL